MANQTDGPASPYSELQGWIGRTETTKDEICAAPLRGLSATLDRDDPPPARGTPVPPLWHWLFFLPQHPAAEIGHDGHARRGGFLPPVPLPRRMWAGGRFTWERANPLRVGDAVERMSRVASVKHKAGRSGDLVFVTVVHEIRNATGLVLTEDHDIVYRGPARPGDAAPQPIQADSQFAWQRIVTPDEVLLFRYSALTFNGHRIHYDRIYAVGAENYPGLVVHGPLIATLLLDLLRREAPDAFVTRFEFKAVRPSFDGEPLHLKGQPDRDSGTVRLWAHDAEGRLAMQASATIART